MLCFIKKSVIYFALQNVNFPQNVGEQDKVELPSTDRSYSQTIFLSKRIVDRQLLKNRQHF